MSRESPATTKCTRCGARIDECACCEEQGCGAAICYGCLNVVLGQEMPHPHAHGG